jgi:hypothetical protein
MKFLKRALVLFFVLFAAEAGAANISLSEQYNLPVQNVVNGNSYSISEKSVISGLVNGDVMAISGDIVYSGKSSEDALMIGGTLTAPGETAEDFRGIGGKLSFNGKTGKDLVLIGGSVDVLRDTDVSGDLYIISGATKINGDIKGSVFVASGDLVVEGNIEGNVLIFSVGKIEVKNGAKISGTLTHYSDSSVVLENGASVVGGIKHEFRGPIITASDVRGFVFGIFGWIFLIRLLIGLVTVTIFVLAFPKLSAEIVKTSTTSPLTTTLLGIAAMIIFPFAALFLTVTVLGSLAGSLVFVMGGFVAILAKIYASVIFGYFVIKIFRKREVPDVIPYKDAMLAVLAAHIAYLIPIFGWMLWVLVFVTAFGGTTKVMYRRFFANK